MLLSSFTLPHIIPNPCDFLPLVETQQQMFSRMFTLLSSHGVSERTAFIEQDLKAHLSNYNEALWSLCA